MASSLPRRGRMGADVRAFLNEALGPVTAAS